MEKKRLHLSSQVFIEKLFSLGKSIPGDLSSTAIYPVLKHLREALHMTQEQLSKLSGLPQSHIAKIEAGKTDVQLKTLERLFNALQCDVAVVPRPRQKFDVLIRERAHLLAEKKVSRLMGSMSLEKQTPDDITRRVMIQEEEKRILFKPTPRIWDEG